MQLSKPVSDFEEPKGGVGFYPKAFHKYAGRILTVDENAKAGEYDVIRVNINVYEDAKKPDVSRQDDYTIFQNEYLEQNVVGVIKAVLNSKQNDNILTPDQKNNLNSNNPDLNNLAGCYITVTYMPQQKKVDGKYVNTGYTQLRFVNSTYKFDNTICTNEAAYKAFEQERQGMKQGGSSSDSQTASSQLTEDDLPF